MTNEKRKGLWSRLFGKPTDKPKEKSVEAEKALKAMKIAIEALARSRASTKPDVKPFVPAGIPDFMKKPFEDAGNPVLASDSNIAAAATWAGGGYGQYGYAFTEGLQFLGYPYLAELTQRPEYRRMVEIIAQEATRKWIRITSADDGDEDPDNDKAREDKIAKIVEEMDRLNVREVFKAISEQDGFYGRAHLYLDTGDTDNPDELKKPLGNGDDAVSKAKVTKKKPLLAIRAVEAVWTYPTSYNSNDPLKGDWYNPDMWFVMGKQVHASRLLPFVSRPVADLLKPAYSFGGLALTQMAKPYVDNWLQTRQSVNDIISAFNVFVLATNMSSVLQGGGIEAEMARAELFNNFRNNRGIFMVDKETEEFRNVSAPLSSLDLLQAQAQEHQASVSGIPLVKLLGITPSGLNACLVGDTMITTDRGEVAIKDVTTNDKVLTREGFAPLTFAGKTKYATELFEIKTANETLLCTGNHPIWLPEVGEFVPAENVLRGDRLLLIGERLDALKTLHQSRGEVNGGGSAKTATMPRGAQKQSDQFSCTEEYGKCTEGQSQKDGISTIEMETSPTTSLTTLSLCQPSYTLNCMASTSTSAERSHRKAEKRHASIVKKSLKSKNCLAEKSGAQKIADLHIEEQQSHQWQSLSQHASVRNVEYLSQPLGEAQSTAHVNVQRPVKIVEHIHGPTIAPILTSGSEQTSKTSAETKCDGLVISVRKIPANEWVYDLTVGDGHLPEFFANGILTHNSSEGEIRVFYDTIGAYQEAFFRDALTKVICFIQLSLFGEVDPAIKFQFEPLMSLDDKELAEARKMDAETAQILIDTGVISPDEERKRIAADPDSPYQNLGTEEEDMPSLLDEEEEGLVPKGGGSAVNQLFKADEVK